MVDDGRPAILPQEITIRREDKIRQSKIDIHEFIERARTDVRNSLTLRTFLRMPCPSGTNHQPAHSIIPRSLPIIIDYKTIRINLNKFGNLQNKACFRLAFGKDL